MKMLSIGFGGTYFYLGFMIMFLVICKKVVPLHGIKVYHLRINCSSSEWNYSDSMVQNICIILAIYMIFNHCSLPHLYHYKGRMLTVGIYANINSVSTDHL